jgi:hypothetical protein
MDKIEAKIQGLSLEMVTFDSPGMKLSLKKNG